METKEIDSKKYFKDLKIVVGNSEAKFRKHGEPSASWPDNGDFLIVDYEDEKLSAIKFVRDDFMNNKLADKSDEEHYTYEFNIDNAKTIAKRVSEHLLFICIENLSPPRNISRKVTEDLGDKYKLEIITQCDCGHNTQSTKHKVNFYFYKYDENSKTTKHKHHTDVGNGNQPGTGGGWSSPPA